MELREVVTLIKSVLDEKDALREEALKLTREIVRLSGDAVKALHRGELDVAGERIEKALELNRKLESLLRDHPDLYSAGYVMTAQQELVEAALLHSYLMGKGFPSPGELGVHVASYALGLGDLVGELRRHVLLRLMEGKLEDARATFEFMESLYEELSTLEYPKGLVNIRGKVDAARGLVERTLEDLTRAIVNRRLEERIDAVLNNEGKT